MPTRTAIAGASLEELDTSHTLRKVLTHKRIANFDFYEGELHGKPVVILITGWGKVRASQGITVLNYNYSISKLFFVGVCGAIGEWKQGDICIPLLFDYFDFNAFPLLDAYTYPKFQEKAKPATAGSDGSEELRAMSLHPAVANLRQEFGELVSHGLVLSGDSFVSDPDIIHRTGKLKNGAIIDMESTAIAESCTNLGIDFLVIRIVSDTINADSHSDFKQFLDESMPKMVNSILKIIVNC